MILVIRILLIILILNCFFKCNSSVNFSKKSDPNAQSLSLKDLVDEFSNKDEVNITGFDSIYYNDSILIHVVDVITSLRVNQVYIFAQNKNSKQSSMKPIVIDNSWGKSNENGFIKKYRLLSPPLFGFQDVNGDSKTDFYFKRRAHNGTMYNAEVIFFFSMDNLELEHIFSFESKTSHPFEDCLISRELENSAIQVFCKCENSPSRELIGNFKIVWNGSSPSIVDKSIVNDYFADLLVTGSGIDENKFISYMPTIH